MHKPSIRGALAFGIPVLLVFAFTAWYPQGYYVLAAGPLCGIVGGLVLSRRLGVSIVLGLCFFFVGFMFFLQEARSTLFSDVIWTGIASAVMFWVAGGSAVMTLPASMRFNAAAAVAIPGAIAGFAFQFLWGPGRVMFDLSSRAWWTAFPWEHLVLWLIAGAGSGFLLGLNWRQAAPEETAKFTQRNRWAFASLICGSLGLGLSGLYLLRSALPLGLFNSLSPASAAADWLWGWGLLATPIALIAALKPHRRLWSAGGMALAVILVVVSYRVAADPWKAQFNSNYAQKLLRDNPGSGEAIYVGNLILAQVALDNNDIANAKHHLLQAASTSGSRRIETSGLDTSVARVLLERDEKDAVLQYFARGKELWPQGAQNIARWEAAIKAGRRPNFGGRGGGGGGAAAGGGAGGYGQQDR